VLTQPHIISEILFGSRRRHHRDQHLQRPGHLAERLRT
jgi:hypothetical protein